LARVLAAEGIPVSIHGFTDGRDTPPRSAPGFVAAFEAALPPGRGWPRSPGRYWAMDRDNRWERVERAWRAIVLAEGDAFADAQAAIAGGHAQDVSDEFLAPAILPGHTGMQHGDGLLCFNFRADRVREILAALLEPGFFGFARPRSPRFATALGMVEYSRELNARMGRCSRRNPWRTSWAPPSPPPAAPSSAWPKRRSTRTSPGSSMAATRCPMTARAASWCPRPRSPPTTSSRR
jgi:2,3-bisphosphoglycerate-independent phosphoglycerate mutase